MASYLCTCATAGFVLPCVWHWLKEMHESWWLHCFVHVCELRVKFLCHYYLSLPSSAYTRDPQELSATGHCYERHHFGPLFEV